jgi:hypothetical protein
MWHASVSTWRLVLSELRRPVRRYVGVPLPPGMACPVFGCGHGGVCRYDLTNRKGTIDGRCLTKREALK